MIVHSKKYLTQEDSPDFELKIYMYIEQFIFSLNISLKIIVNLALSLKNYILEKR